jgi:hypothetical protein
LFVIGKIPDYNIGSIDIRRWGVWERRLGILFHLDNRHCGYRVLLIEARSIWVRRGQIAEI